MTEPTYSGMRAEASDTACLRGFTKWSILTRESMERGAFSGSFSASMLCTEKSQDKEEEMKTKKLYGHLLIWTLPFPLKIFKRRFKIFKSPKLQALYSVLPGSSLSHVPTCMHDAHAHRVSYTIKSNMGFMGCMNNIAKPRHQTCQLIQTNKKIRIMGLYSAFSGQFFLLISFLFLKYTQWFT